MAGAPDIDRFFADKRTVEYQKGEIIVRVGEVPAGVYWIRQGYVKAYSLTEAGEQNLHFIYRQQELFPFVWAVHNREPRSYYEAMGPVTVQRAGRDEFVSFLEQRPAATMELLRYATAMLRASFDRVNNLEFTTAYPRVIVQLLFLAKRFGAEQDGAVTFDIPITQQDIADSINVTRETASKELNVLAKKGIIDCKDKYSLTIHDLDELKREYFRYYDAKAEAAA